MDRLYGGYGGRSDGFQPGGGSYRTVTHPCDSRFRGFYQCRTEGSGHRSGFEADVESRGYYRCVSDL
ncbi:hypothetical protein BJV78DRAFT_1249722 [Lactifluus subvellereus]|nr:hypothetical protein BJV78DRAFT_1249722 [Lactifluus subvellereus]